MALKATIYKAELQIADMDRHYYQTHNLTLARHPSETNERLMIRLLAFALNANESLQFCKGLSSDEEPDLWQHSLSGELEIWIELGQVDEKRIRKACARAQKVFIYTYQERNAKVWWQQIENKLKDFKNLRVIQIADETSSKLESLCQRNMSLQCSIQDGTVWLSDNQNTAEIHPLYLK